MSRIRKTDTKCEQILRSELWRLGLRFRKNFKDLPGKPDVVFVRARVAVFCDGDFWHGRHWQARRAKLAAGRNSEYWIAKIEANMLRDGEQEALLFHMGWLVFRLWESDIKWNPREAALSVAEAVKSRARAASE